MIDPGNRFHCQAKNYKDNFVEIEFVIERLTHHPEYALDSNHQIKYSLIGHLLLHFVVESRIPI